MSIWVRVLAEASGVPLIFMCGLEKTVKTVKNGQNTEEKRWVNAHGISPRSAETRRERKKEFSGEWIANRQCHFFKVS